MYHRIPHNDLSMFLTMYLNSHNIIILLLLSKLIESRHKEEIKKGATGSHCLHSISTGSWTDKNPHCKTAALKFVPVLSILTHWIVFTKTKISIDFEIKDQKLESKAFSKSFNTNTTCIFLTSVKSIESYINLVFYPMFPLRKSDWVSEMK